MAISSETVRYVADLSRIELSESELTRLSGQLEAILRFIDTLAQADVSNVSPTSHILPLNNVMRQDVPRQSLPLEKSLANAPEREGAFFVSPKVID